MLSRYKKRTYEITTVLVVTAAVLYCSWPLGFILNPRAQRTGLASELGAAHQPYNWLFIWADIVSGALLLMACGLLARQYRTEKWRFAGLVLLGLYGLCGALDAALPLSCLPSEQVCGSVFHSPMLVVHGVIDILGSTALVGTLVAEWLYARRLHPTWVKWIYLIGSGGVLFGVLSAFFLLTRGPGYWAQRYYITLSCIWVASLPFAFRAQSKGMLEKL